MKKTLVVLGLIGSALAAPAMATEVSDYQNVEVGVGKVGDIEGVKLGGKLGLTQSVYLTGAVMSGEHKDTADLDATSYELGLGVHRDLSNYAHGLPVDAFAEVSYLKAKVDDAGVKASDEGYRTTVGLRGNVGLPELTVEATVGYREMTHSEDEVEWGLGADYALNQKVSVGVDYLYGQDTEEDTVFANVKYRF